jgi:hypothetical protein
MMPRIVERAIAPGRWHDAVMVGAPLAMLKRSGEGAEGVTEEDEAG